MTTTNVSRLGEFLSAVKAIRRKWNVPDDNELWFRAEDSVHRKTHLQPGLYRPTKSGGKFSVPKLLDLEDHFYEDFRRCATQLSDARSQSDDWEWDSYFLMQHHGVPTRLLDWSDGALIALHFAIRGKAIPATTGSTVFVLDPYWLLRELAQHPDRIAAKKRWKKYAEAHPSEASEDEWDRLYLPSDEDDEADPLLATPIIPVLFDSPHVTRRVAAQRSRFMIFGTDSTWLAKLKRNPVAKITALTIGARSIKNIRLELQDAGITESVVFPDLDGLGRELRQQWNTMK